MNQSNAYPYFTIFPFSFLFLSQVDYSNENKITSVSKQMGKLDGKIALVTGGSE
jgi:hypothetical protein